MSHGHSIVIPADVPGHKKQEFIHNYNAITRHTDRLLLFAADHKIEHLHTDFYGPHIDQSANNPEHIFKIAAAGKIGALATQLGLIARYGARYTAINYIVKLNSKTNIIATDHKDPLSTQLWSIQDVVNFKEQSKLAICGVGYTVYLGSEQEHIMLAQAAQIIYQAHQQGLVALLWVYPRGKYVTNERDGNIIAGAAGVATCLGADFAKINLPDHTATQTSSELLKIVIQTAGNTKIICAGGNQVVPPKLITQVHEQLTVGTTAGCAIGRNIYQHSLEQAVAITDALAALIYDKCDLATALGLLAK